MIALALWAGMSLSLEAAIAFIFGNSIGSIRFPDMYVTLGYNLRHADYIFGACMYNYVSTTLIASPMYYS